MLIYLTFHMFCRLNLCSRAVAMTLGTIIVPDRVYQWHPAMEHQKCAFASLVLDLNEEVWRSGH